MHVHGLPSWFKGKESACSAGDPSLISGSGKPPWRRAWDPLQHSSWRIPWTEEPGRLQSMGSQSDMTERLSSSSNVHTHIFICVHAYEYVYNVFLHTSTHLTNMCVDVCLLKCSFELHG